MRRRPSFRFSIVLVLALLHAGWTLVAMPEARAQQQPGQQGAQAGPSPPAGDLSERISRLEQRILDLQTVIATLQSFVGDRATVSTEGGLPAADSAPGGGTGGTPNELGIRVIALETQIRALTGQMEQITARLDRMSAGGGTGASPLPQDQGPLQSGRQSSAATPPYPAPQVQTPGAPGQIARPAAPVPQFGTTMNRPGPANPFADPRSPTPQQQSVSRPPLAPGQTAQLPPLAGLSGGGGARSIYDASYQNFLRNDFQAAEQGFRDFVKTYPDDPLASNAYYWLGRTLFERKQFEPAAKAFLAGFKKDKKSAIAPDSLLHLGMSLAQLGEKDAACSTLGAIGKQFPNAPEQLKKDVSAALKRARC